MRHLSALILTTAALTLAGCRGTAGPASYGPMKVEDQQQYAEIYDPYPSTEVGPEVVGGRPRDYQKPVAQTRRDQPERWSGSYWNPMSWFGW